MGLTASGAVVGVMPAAHGCRARPHAITLSLGFLAGMARVAATSTSCPAGYTSSPHNLDGGGKTWSYPSCHCISGCAAACHQRSGCTSFEFDEAGGQNHKCGTYTAGDANVQSENLRLVAVGSKVVKPHSEKLK